MENFPSKSISSVDSSLHTGRGLPRTGQTFKSIARAKGTYVSHKVMWRSAFTIQEAQYFASRWWCLRKCPVCAQVWWHRSSYFAFGFS